MKLGGVAGIIQRDLDRLKDKAVKNLLEFNKGKHEISLESNKRSMK